MYLVEAKELCKVFKKRVALDSLSLNLTSGAVYGVLGRNGAGKTTLMRIIMGLARPTSGVVKVFGQTPATGDGRLGYLPENIALFPHLSVMENLRIVFLMAGIPKTKIKIEGLIEEVGLADASNKPARSLSLGMKRRLQLAMTVLSREHEILILDEPTNGLDVSGLIWFKTLVARMRQSGVTVLLATHSIKEMEELVSDYLIIDHGRIIDQGNWNINAPGLTNGITIVADVRQLQNCLNVLQNKGINNYRVQGNNVMIETLPDTTHLLRLLTEHGVYPDELRTNRKTLEQVFLAKTQGSNIDAPDSNGAI